jgi:hypothetical protein
MRPYAIVSVCFFTAAFFGAAHSTALHEQNWTNYVRIGAYGLHSGNAGKIVRDAERGHVFGIEVDNDIPGRYESFLDPTEKLEAIRAVADEAHEAKNRAFVYIAGTECITANAQHAQHTVMKDHPDWLQRDISGKPAVFDSTAAFWIKPGDEDVWISPYAKAWRAVYMKRVRQIAATGIDGIYVDIPYWMTHFAGWEDTWASFDDATVAAFKSKYGLDARHDLELGDFSDPGFRKWVVFRIATMTDFVREILENARSINPEIKVIPEIYPGIEEEAVRVGADVYQMYPAVDAIAHEYEFGSGDHMASSRTIMDWFLYQAGMLTFRSFAQGKATWILNYSWDGDKGVAPAEAMKTLAASEITAGANFWDAPGHSMSGSNDPATRAQIFSWIQRYERKFYRPRLPIRPTGVYFSPSSRNFDSAHFLPSYRGTLLLLLQQHLEFQVVTPRTLGEFQGSTLVLPGVSTLDDNELAELEAFLSSGGRLVILGSDATKFATAKNVLRLPDAPGAAYFNALQKDFAAASRKPPRELLDALPPDKDLVINASPFVATNTALVNGRVQVFFASFAGLVPHHNLIPTAESAATITVPASPERVLHFLPFLGDERTVSAERVGNSQVFHLPPFERAAVAWLENAP